LTAKNVQGDRMAIADLIYEQTKKLPEHLAREVLDFVGYLAERQTREQDRDLIDAQEAALKAVWDNDEDQAWDRV
jgi:S-adenosylmethionine:diacylglycerol 3-amino-3-carboxypropyl transferase